jgi:hypothetical protein
MSPLPAPQLDTRSYQQLVDEALARIPVHTPEWTNFNRSDPGVTLVELFAFLTESVLYRANQVPERNRRAFLSLLGVPLQPASSAQGLVTIDNERGERRALTLAPDLEVRAGTVPFRTTLGLEVLPVEGRVFVKRALPSASDELLDYYRALYASFREGAEPAPELELYETVPLTAGAAEPVDLVEGTVDRSLWIALLQREVDGAATAESLAAVREQLDGRTLSIGLAPAAGTAEAELYPGGRFAAARPADLAVEVPNAAAGTAGATAGERVAAYRPLDVRASVDVLETPGILQVTLPDRSGLELWDDLDPIEAGVGDFPPALEDSKLAARVVTWVRVRAGRGARASVLWAGINATTISQRATVTGEALPEGTGAPDQTARLARTPVIADSVRLRVTAREGAAAETTEWEQVPDLAAAGPEVPVPDARRPPGSATPPPRPSKVFALDPESGVVRFGDALRGARPPAGARLRVDYAYGAGRAGNVGRGTVATSPSLPGGFRVTNPVRTWGGAEGETVSEGEKQVARFLQHRDRLVSAEDFEAIVRRAPGVDVGRVEVLEAFSPELPSSDPGDAAGAVTLMLVPRHDPARPTAPSPDQAFLDAVCRHVEPRRLVTTEVFLRGPAYVGIWVSVGIDVEAGRSFAEVRDAVSGALAVYLSPLPRELAVARAGRPLGDDTTYPHAERGWPLAKDVVALELQAVASRVEGVRLVRGLLLGRSTGGPDDVAIRGLALPRLEGVVVAPGAPLSLDRARGVAPPSDPTPSSMVPVPVVPETC